MHGKFIDLGITNCTCRVTIIDASMAAAIRTSGQMWGIDGKAHDTKAMIPIGVMRPFIKNASNSAKRTARLM
jgi:monomeric isocitrate dehydrogenase